MALPPPFLHDKDFSFRPLRTAREVQAACRLLFCSSDVPYQHKGAIKDVARSDASH